MPLMWSQNLLGLDVTGIHRIKADEKRIKEVKKVKNLTRMKIILILWTYLFVLKYIEIQYTCFFFFFLKRLEMKTNG